MRRIGIFSFYDREGVVDDYIAYLLNELKSVTERLIIVVNGFVNEQGYTIFESFTDEILIRSNFGFDAGAYTDILLNYIGKQELKKWGEVVLCNDTFYGPFVPLKKIFSAMEKSPCDFWGLNYVEAGILSYIQSYFLVFRREIISSGDLIDYLENNINIREKNIKNVYATYEVGVFVELTRIGYKYDTYCNTCSYNTYTNPYTSMKAYGLPILKKKVFVRESYLACLQYILWNTEYDINMIIQNVKRLHNYEITLQEINSFDGFIMEPKNKCFRTIVSAEEISCWAKNCDFYIYGAGVIARQVYFNYLQTMERFQGFVVSDDQVDEEKKLYGFPIYHMNQIEKDANILVCIRGIKDIGKRQKDSRNYLMILED